MSSRPCIKPFVSISSGDMSGSLNGKPSIINELSMMSYAFSWSGSSPVGTVSVQVSNDYALNPGGGVANAGTWNTLTFNYGGSPTTNIPLTGNTGNGLVEILQTGAYAIRPVYSFTSGTGNLTAVFTAKVS
jgi:hypothetical protein